jgi:Zn-dependent protease
MAFVCAAGAVGVGLLGRAVNDGAPGITMETTRFLFTMLYGGMYINVVLAVFNILPVPPLDGSHVLAAALPPRAAMRYQRIGFLGVLVLLLAMRVQAVNEAFFGAIGLTFAPFRALVDMFL